jgi:hypothetical protein
METTLRLTDEELEHIKKALIHHGKCVVAGGEGETVYPAYDIILSKITDHQAETRDEI